MYLNYLTHDGILGQKWGVRRFQNPDGTYTAEGLIRKAQARVKNFSDSKIRQVTNKSAARKSAKQLRADSKDYRKIESMSTEDLRSETSRINAEVSYAKALANKAAYLDSIAAKKPGALEAIKTEGEKALMAGFMDGLKDASRSMIREFVPWTSEKEKSKERSSSTPDSGSSSTPDSGSSSTPDSGSSSTPDSGSAVAAAMSMPSTEDPWDAFYSTMFSTMPATTQPGTSWTEWANSIPDE